MTFSWVETDRRLADLFLDDAYPVASRYRALFRYWISGFLFYRTPDGAHAQYPGEPSYHGTQIDHMEGFTRILPLIGVWVRSGRSGIIQPGNGECPDLKGIVRKGLSAGTDPESEGYWGPIRDFDQRAHEAADVALSLWLLRDSIWKEMTRPERERVVTWLRQVNGRKVTDNNWHHIPVVVNKVLQSLECDWDEGLVQRHYTRWKAFYTGEGWFSDGPGGVFDYYNAWGMHYTLFWLGEMDPEFDPDFIRESRKAFLGTYKYFPAPSGIPIMGRSIGYRMAAAAPLVAGALKLPEVVSPGLGRRALDSLWRHFIARGALAEGNVTQGYWQKNLRFLDNYCGPASCLWALRSLILAFYSPDQSPFWQDPEELLPVEKADFEVRIPSPGWILLGCRSRGEVKIVIEKNNPGKRVKIRGYTGFDRLKGMLRGRPNRPENREAAYGLREYSSLHPFCEFPDEPNGKDAALEGV